MDDLISRQAAIDAINKAFKRVFEWDGTELLGEKVLKDVPSAQPEQRCDTCRYRNLEWHEEPCDSCTQGGEANHYKPSAEPEYSLDEWCEDCKEYDREKHSCPRFNRVIRETLKEAQPERSKGKWMPHIEKSREYIGTVLVNVKYDYWLCDTCGYRVGNRQPTYNFCPNCGADMRGGT